MVHFGTCSTQPVIKKYEWCTQIPWSVPEVDEDTVHFGFTMQSQKSHQV